MEPISFPTGAFYFIPYALSYPTTYKLADSFSSFDNNFGGVACNGAVLLDGVLFFYGDTRGVFGYAGPENCGANDQLPICTTRPDDAQPSSTKVKQKSW